MLGYTNGYAVTQVMFDGGHAYVVSMTPDDKLPPIWRRINGNPDDVRDSLISQGYRYI